MKKLILICCIALCAPLFSPIHAEGTQYIPKGYRKSITAAGGVLINNYAIDYGVSLFTTHGYQTSAHFFIGGGAGVNYYPEIGTVDVPVYVAIQGNSNTRKVQFTCGARAGYEVYNSGVYSGIDVGLRVALATKTALDFTPYVDYIYDWSTPKSHRWISGLRISVEF